MNQEDYDIKLYLSIDNGEGSNNDRGSGLTIFVRANDGEKLFDGWKLKVDSRKVAQLEIAPKKINFVASDDSWTDNSNCFMNRISSAERNVTTNYEVNYSDILFECKEENPKKYSFGKRECDIQFSPKNKLKWNDLKPKLKFSAF